ncbi:MAG TPA: hypothetical protein PLL30_00210 [Candidatus Krumholzibacteria bacterium]|nr:hypothetical protein [Candidatus Krumholzibacteria bacterium]HPD70181.1 hypothetical protein [Candidatus Krumholzibacteria bacterium]HRY40119.1 hypothetical protein [Candidatus Krumholzibacteria bacterium]
MKPRQTILVLALAGLATVAAGNPLPGCGWEDCPETVLGLAGPGMEPIIASLAMAPDPVLEGIRSLRLVHNAPGWAPRAYLAYVDGVGNGDRIMVEIARYAAAPGIAPCRIRGRYNDSLPDLDVNDGDAGGPDDPGGLGWQWVSYTWEMAGGHSGLVIDVEMTGEAGDTVWLDMMIVVPPGDCTLAIPCYTVVPAQGRTYSAVKDLFR